MNRPLYIDGMLSRFRMHIRGQQYHSYVDFQIGVKFVSISLIRHVRRVFQNSTQCFFFFFFCNFGGELIFELPWRKRAA